MVDEIISKLMETKHEPEDYVGTDGLLYCGKCHTPKQIRLEQNPFTNDRVPFVVPTSCHCQHEADMEAEARAKRQQFEAKMTRFREDGITCPGSLRHTFADDDGRLPNITAICKRYVDNWCTMVKQNIGVIFYGSVGTGKSFYASCIANALLDKQVTATATSFPRLLNLLQGTPDKQKLLDSLNRYNLLILDDLGVERDSTFGLEQIFNVIDARKNANLPVIVTTNLGLDELKAPSSMPYARIYDRVLEMCPVTLKLTGESRRKQSAESRKHVAQKILLG